MRKIFIVLMCVVNVLSVFSQYAIRSSIIDGETKQPMEFVSVRLLNNKDSALIVAQSTDAKGAFSLENISSGTYLLNVSYVGYQNYYTTVKLTNQSLKLDNIELMPNANLLEELKVQGTAVQVIVKNDTIEYNAQAFKTSKNAVVKELLKKMPGVEVDSEGKITVNGQEITKILVDGKKFFGNDTQMATNNIPANLIDKVQVIDQKSEMAQLTGFEDGETERVINLTFKESKKQGVFGSIEAGVGADIQKDFRYDGNAFLNIMNGDTRSTITAGANNTNTSRSRSGRGGFGSGSNAGITETQNFGYNINTSIADKLIVGGDVAFNHSGNTAISGSKRETYVLDTTFTNLINSNADIENYSTNVRFELEWKPDSLKKIILQPTLNYNRSFGNSASYYLYLQELDTASSGKSINNTNGNQLEAGMNVIYNQKLNKPGRTLTARLSLNASASQDNGFNYSLKNSTNNFTSIDQRSYTQTDDNNVALRLSYVEPLWNNYHLVEVSADMLGVFRNSTRNLFNKDKQNKYNVLNKAYSNQFENSFFSQGVGLNYRFVQKKYNMMFGIRAEPSQTYSKTIYGDGTTFDFSNSVLNFAPTAQIQYNLDKRNFLRLNYNGKTSQPTIAQMQPVKNNTDLMNETVGNPLLNPAFNHRLRFMYSNYNANTFSSLNIGIFGTLTKDALTSNSIYDQSGKRYIQTVNGEKMPYRIHLFSMYNQPFLKKFNFSNHFSVGANMQYGYTAKNVSAEDIDIEHISLGALSSSLHYSLSEQIGLSYTHDVFDIQARGGLLYTHFTNNLDANIRQTYDWSSSLSLGVRPASNLSLSADITYNKQLGYSDYNPSQWLCNGTIEVSVFNGKGVLALKAFDILQQRQNVFQTVGENYIQYTNTNVLPAYYLVSFAFKINKFNGGTETDKEELETLNERESGRRPHGEGGRPHLGRGGKPPKF